MFFFLYKVIYSFPEIIFVFKISFFIFSYIILSNFMKILMKFVLSFFLMDK